MEKPHIDVTQTKYFDRNVIHLRLPLAPRYTWCRRQVRLVRLATTNPAQATCRLCALAVERIYQVRPPHRYGKWTV